MLNENYMDSMTVNPEVFDDDDDDEELALAEFDDDDDDETISEDDDDEEGAYEFSASNDDDDDEEILPFLAPLIGAAAPAIVGGISNLIKGGRSSKRRVSTRRVPSRHAAIRGSLARGSIVTRRGRIPIRFRKRFVTPAELRIVTQGLRRDIVGTKKEVRRVDRNAIRRDATVRKHVGRVMAQQNKVFSKALKRQRKKLKATEESINKKLNDTRQMMMFMTLLQSPPEIESLTLETGVAAGETRLDVRDTNYEDDNNNLLPFLMFSGDGMFGGNDSNNMLAVLALSGNL